MARKNSFATSENDESLLPGQLVNTAYDKIEAVASNIDAVLAVSDALGDGGLLTSMAGYLTDAEGEVALAAAQAAIAVAQANIATTKSASAMGYADDAEGHKVEAAVSSGLAAAKLAEYKGIYYGAFANEAAVGVTDPNGDPINLGDTYFDIAADTIKVYTSTGWVVSTVTPSLASGITVADAAENYDGANVEEVLTEIQTNKKVIATKDTLLYGPDTMENVEGFPADFVLYAAGAKAAQLPYSWYAKKGDIIVIHYPEGDFESEVVIYTQGPSCTLRDALPYDLTTSISCSVYSPTGRSALPTKLNGAGDIDYVDTQRYFSYIPTVADALSSLLSTRELLTVPTFLGGTPAKLGNLKGSFVLLPGTPAGTRVQGPGVIYHIDHDEAAWEMLNIRPGDICIVDYVDGEQSNTYPYLDTRRFFIVVEMTADRILLETSIGSIDAGCTITFHSPLTNYVNSLVAGGQLVRLLDPEREYKRHYFNATTLWVPSSFLDYSLDIMVTAINNFTVGQKIVIENPTFGKFYTTIVAPGDSGYNWWVADRIPFIQEAGDTVTTYEDGEEYAGNIEDALKQTNTKLLRVVQELEHKVNYEAACDTYSRRLVLTNVPITIDATNFPDITAAQHVVIDLKNFVASASGELQLRINGVDSSLSGTLHTDGGASIYNQITGGNVRLLSYTAGDVISGTINVYKAWNTSVLRIRSNLYNETAGTQHTAVATENTTATLTSLRMVVSAGSTTQGTAKVDVRY